MKPKTIENCRKKSQWYVPGVLR